MRRSTTFALATGAAAALTTGVLLTLPSDAAPRSATPANRAQAAPASGLPTVTFLPLRLAQRAAEAAIGDCRRQGQQVAATVVDAEGVVIAQLRSDGVTAASLDASKGKAYAAAGFRSPTDALARNASSNPGLLQVPGFVILAGGLPISSGGRVVAGIGVGGAPSGAIDQTCAQAGIAAIAGSL
ncbi:MAG TPA: heme-binding protein [Jatrophihabitans sp.]|nr:heme-binding protein [Jatrophihabitans sp.]